VSSLSSHVTSVPDWSTPVKVGRRVRGCIEMALPIGCGDLDRNTVRQQLVTLNRYLTVGQYRLQLHAVARTRTIVSSQSYTEASQPRPSEAQSLTKSFKIEILRVWN
jgi:hypothetical protein